MGASATHRQALDENCHHIGLRIGESEQLGAGHELPGAAALAVAALAAAQGDGLAATLAMAPAERPSTPVFCVAGTSSGVGKTSICVGIMRALRCAPRRPRPEAVPLSCTQH